MRIKDLLEGKDFDKDMDFVQSEGDKKVLNYDLIEDLTFFMNDDDDTYRRHVYPSIVKCLDKIKNKQDTSPSLFTNAVRESYKNYIKKFPIRELPDELEEKLLKDACKKMHEDLKSHHGDGKYKD